MRPCACIICAIQRATDRIIAYRITRAWRNDDMAMQLKGLRAKAMGFRVVLDDVGKAYDEGSTAATLHATEVRSLAAEFKDLKDDLDFAIGTVGNSSAVTGTGEAKERPPEKQVVTEADVGKLADVLAEGQQPASQPPGSTASTEPGNEPATL